jgi:hypothetical protein
MADGGRLLHPRDPSPLARLAPLLSLLASTSHADSELVAVDGGQSCCRHPLTIIAGSDGPLAAPDVVKIDVLNKVPTAKLV